MPKKIKNTTEVKRKIDAGIPLAELNTYLYKNHKALIDFSFEGAFVSCKHGYFDNYLLNEKEFIYKTKELLLDVQRLSQKALYVLLSGGFRHCHIAKDSLFAEEIIKKVFERIDKTDENYKQELGGEEIFQIGLHSPIRLFGTIQGNVFRVYFIDFHHCYEFDERRNTRNEKGNRFSLF